MRGRLIALVGVGFHQPFDDFGHALGNIRVDGANRPDTGVAGKLPTLLAAVRARIRGDAGQQLVIDAAQEIEVAARIVRRGVGAPLERGVFEGPLQAVAAGLGIHDFVAGQAEVDQFGDSLRAHQHVGQLEVAVRDPHAGRVFEPLGHVDQAASGLDDREPLADVEKVAEVAPFDELHREVVAVALTGDIVDRDDLLVFELFAEVGLTAEEAHDPRIGRPPLTQHLQSDHPTVGQRGTAVDAGKAPRRVAVQQLVVAQNERVRFTPFKFSNLIRREQVAALERLKQNIRVVRGRARTRMDHFKLIGLNKVQTDEKGL